MAACGRENEVGSGTKGGGDDSNPEATLTGVRFEVGECVEATVGTGANNLLVTA